MMRSEAEEEPSAFTRGPAFFGSCTIAAPAESSSSANHWCSCTLRPSIVTVKTAVVSVLSW